MAEVSYGKIMITPKGEFKPLMQYDALDVITYQGSSYVSKFPTTENLPTNTDYWQLLAHGFDSNEVEEARVNADGTITYETLKERLDAENQEIMTQLEEVANKTIDSGTDYPTETYPKQMFFKII